MRVLSPIMSTLLAASCALGASVDEWLRTLPDFALRAEYTPLVQRPLQYVGFSFGGPDAELQEMRDAGANAAGLGEMWDPQAEPGAPYGVGVRPGNPSCRCRSGSALGAQDDSPCRTPRSIIGPGNRVRRRRPERQPELCRSEMPAAPSCNAFRLG